MKKPVSIMAVAIVVLLTSCAVKYGCPTSAKSMGAEKLLMGDKKTLKQAARASKYRVSKF